MRGRLRLTRSVREKIGQMESAALRAYLAGPDTLESRRRILEHWRRWIAPNCGCDGGCRDPTSPKAEDGAGSPVQVLVARLVMQRAVLELASQGRSCRLVRSWRSDWRDESRERTLLLPSFSALSCGCRRAVTAAALADLAGRGRARVKRAMPRIVGGRAQPADSGRSLGGGEPIYRPRCPIGSGRKHARQPTAWHGRNRAFPVNRTAERVDGRAPAEARAAF